MGTLMSMTGFAREGGALGDGTAFVWELRSVNGQIEYLLREAVRRRKGGDPAPTPPRADEGEQDVGA